MRGHERRRAASRISLEETTPLHKQHNCGGVRANIAPERRGRSTVEGTPKAGGGTEGRFYHRRDKTTLLAGEKATKEEIFPASPAYACPSFPYSSLYTRSECARGCVLVCVRAPPTCECVVSRIYTTIYDFLEGREYENTYVPCILRARVMRVARSDANFNDRGSGAKRPRFVILLIESIKGGPDEKKKD